MSFEGFWRAVNAIGCVYADIDRDYYNDSAEFTYIDVEPGYQRLCARKALQYVRFRHEDNDLVRSARQQDFLRQAKQQVTYTKLIDEARPAGEDLRPQHRRPTPSLRSTLRGAAAAEARGLLGRPADPRDPLRGRRSARATWRRATSRSRSSSSSSSRWRTRRARAARPRSAAAAKPRRKRPAASSAVALGLEDASGLGQDQGLQAVQAGAGGSLPVLYPTLRLNASEYADPPRVYKIRGRRQALRRLPDGHQARTPSASTTASRAPPGRTRRSSRTPPRRARIGRREYELHYDGDRLRLVAWRTPEGRLLDLEHAAADADRAGRCWRSRAPRGAAAR